MRPRRRGHREDSPWFSEALREPPAPREPSLEGGPLPDAPVRWDGGAPHSFSLYLSLKKRCRAPSPSRIRCLVGPSPCRWGDLLGALDVKGDPAELPLSAARAHRAGGFRSRLLLFGAGLRLMLGGCENWCEGPVDLSSGGAMAWNACRVALVHRSYRSFGLGKAHDL